MILDPRGEKFRGGKKKKKIFKKIYNKYIFNVQNIHFSKFEALDVFFFSKEITNSKLKKKKKNFASTVIHFISKIIPDTSVKKKEKLNN